MGSQTTRTRMRVDHRVRVMAWTKIEGKGGETDCLELVLFRLGLADQILRVSNSRGCGRGERGGAHSPKFLSAPFP